MRSGRGRAPTGSPPGCYHSRQEERSVAVLVTLDLPPSLIAQERQEMREMQYG